MHKLHAELPRTFLPWSGPQPAHPHWQLKYRFKWPHIPKTLTSTTRSTSEALCATSCRNDLCLRTSPVSLQSMDLPDHPPAEWQIALPKVHSLTCMQRHMPAVCLPKLNITFLISPIDAQIPKGMPVSHTQTHMLWCAAAPAKTQDAL